MLTLKKDNLAIKVFIESNKEYLDCRTGLFDENLADTLAVINDGKTQYEFEVWEGGMICYIADRIAESEPAEYESVEELNVSYIIENSPNLDDFITNIIKFVIEDMEARNE